MTFGRRLLSRRFTGGFADCVLSDDNESAPAFFVATTPEDKARNLRRSMAHFLPSKF
jgi:hypothetical protein